MDNDVEMQGVDENANNVNNGEILNIFEQDPGENEEELIAEQQQKPEQMKKRKKAKRPVFDKKKELPQTIFNRRLIDPFVDCNERLSHVNFEAKLYKYKEANIFHAPVMRNPPETVGLYKRNLTTCEKDDSTTDILRLILNLSIDENVAENENDPNKTNAVVRNQENNADILNEVVPQPRRSGRQRRPAQDNTMICEPIIEDQLVLRHQAIPEVEPEILVPLDEQEIPLSPPVEQDILLPPVEFGQNSSQSKNNNQNAEKNTSSLDSMQVHPSDNEGERDIINYVVHSSPEKSGFSNGANEIVILKLLIKLWNKNTYPIGMDKINKQGESRLQAAKNFASLLGMPLIFSLLHVSLTTFL